MQELLAKYGAETLTRASDQLLDYSERFMRAEIAEMPDGVYYAQDLMEDDGDHRQPVLDAAAPDDPRRRGHLRLDRFRRPGQGPINATFVVTAAACYSGFLHVVSDDIPINSGCLPPDPAGDPARLV